MQMAVPNESIFPKRGKSLRFTINGESRLIKGGIGAPAVVSVNGKPADIHTVVRENDQVNIVFSTRGEDAKCRIDNLAEYRKLADLKVVILVNHHEESPYYEIQDGDIINIGADFSEYDEDDLFGYDFDEEDFEEDDSLDDELMNSYKTELPVQKSEKNFVVSVNGEPVVMKGKDKYIFVNVFDYIDFDLNDSRGRKIVTKVNGVPVANYMQELPDGAIIDIYWEEITLGAKE
jgi:sulfur carrier protein ThiS